VLNEARNLQGREFIVGVSYFTDYKFQFFRTSGLTEVLTPRKFRPREDFPSNGSSELENPNRAGEIFRDGAKFGRRSLQGFVVG